MRIFRIGRLIYHIAPLAHNESEDDPAGGVLCRRFRSGVRVTRLEVAHRQHQHPADRRDDNVYQSE